MLLSAAKHFWVSRSDRVLGDATSVKNFLPVSCSVHNTTVG